MKILVCGDLHTKVDVLNRVIDKSKDFDRVIFLGDYVDDWNKSPEASYNLLNLVLRFKKQYPEKVVLLYGNHDLSEWMGNDFKCSGWNPNTSFLVQDLFNRNQDCFRVAHSEGHILFTHAGVESNWARDNGILLSGDNLAKRIADELNETFRLRGYDRRHNNLFKALATAGPMRGGWHSPSPLWADANELKENPCPFLTQVVGHTPVEGVVPHIFENGDGTKSVLWFCDTFSTTSDGKSIGDGKFLTIGLQNSAVSYNPEV